VTNEPSLEYEKNGTSLKLTGLKSIAQISQYAADAIGIVGEPLGLVKDKLAAFRINQAEAAAVAMQRAQEIKKEANEEIKPVSQKFLANWIEGASQEEVTSENLLELWATLLANSPSKFDARFLAYNEVLRKIGPREANVISRMLYPPFLNGLQSGPNGAYRYCTVESCAATNEIIIRELEKLFDRGQFPQQEIASQRASLMTCRTILDRVLDGFVTEILIRNGSSGTGWGRNDGPGDILEHAGVVTIKKMEVIGPNDTHLTICWAEPTKIGLGLFFELSRSKLLIDTTNGNLDEILHGYPTALSRVPKGIRDIYGIAAI